MATRALSRPERGLDHARGDIVLELWGMTSCRYQVVALGSALVIALSPGVQAQTRFYGEGTVQLGYTDNLFNSSDTPLPGQYGRIASWFVTLAPGAGMYHDSNRARYQFAYTHGFTFYPGFSSQRADSDRGLLQGIFLLSQLDELTLELTASRVTSVGLAGDPTFLGQPQLTGNMTVWTGVLRQTLRHDYSERWRGHQSAAFSILQPEQDLLPDSVRFWVTGGLGAEYRLERDAWDFDLEATYYQVLPTQFQGGYLPAQRYLMVGPTVAWRRDLSAEWASMLRGGVQTAFWLSETIPPGYYPLWNATLQWHRENATVVWSYAGQLAPNLFSSQVYFTQSADMNGRISLLPRSDVALSATLRGSSNRIVGQQSGSGLTVYAWGTDVGIGWFPDNLPQVSLSYVHMEQLDASGTAAVFPGFYRNQVMLTARMRYPTAEWGEIPTRAPVRVDESDRPAFTSPAGAEEADPMSPSGREDVTAPDPAHEPTEDTTPSPAQP